MGHYTSGCLIIMLLGREIVYVGNQNGPSCRKTLWKRWGASPLTFSNGCCSRRGPLRPPKSATSGPEALLSNLNKVAARWPSSDLGAGPQGCGLRPRTLSQHGRAGQCPSGLPLPSSARIRASEPDSAGFYSGKQFRFGPPAGRSADVDVFPNRIRPKSSPEGRFPARKHYCVPYNNIGYPAGPTGERRGFRPS